MTSLFYSYRSMSGSVHLKKSTKMIPFTFLYRNAECELWKQRQHLTCPWKVILNVFLFPEMVINSLNLEDSFVYLIIFFIILYSSIRILSFILSRDSSKHSFVAFNFSLYSYFLWYWEAFVYINFPCCHDRDGKEQQLFYHWVSLVSSREQSIKTPKPIWSKCKASREFSLNY